MEMRESDLEGLRQSAQFGSRHRQYVRRMARYFHRRAERIAAPLDVEDLEQLGLLELWKASSDFQFRCSVCKRIGDTRDAVRRHQARRHGGVGKLWPTMLGYVHARVGRALDHEIRRYERREKFAGEMPAIEPVAPSVSPESVAAFASIVHQAQTDLEAPRARVLRALALNLPPGYYLRVGEPHSDQLIAEMIEEVA